VYDGLAWLDEHWTATENPESGGSWSLYHAYCVERAMDLVGVFRLGDHLWYTEIAEHLFATQEESGRWDRGDTGHKKGAALDTCFALLFLSRATAGTIPYPSVTGGSESPPADTRGK
jgi:hypothetical protein